MLPYILFVSFVSIGTFFQDIKNKYINKIGQCLILFVFFGMAGLSYKLHNDYFVYENVYNWLNVQNINNLKFELGYKYLNYIFNKYLTFYQFKAIVYLINTFLIYTGLRKILTKKETYLTMAFLYIGFSQFYGVYFSAFRQSIAIAIFVYSFSYLKERKAIKYFCLIFIACLFHDSAILLFPIYFFYNLKIKNKMKKNIILYIFFSMISATPITVGVIKKIVIFFINLVGYTINSDYLDSLNYVGYIYTLFILITLILDYKIRDPFLKKEKGDFIYMSLLLFIIANFLGKLLAIFFRVEIYFYVFYFIFFSILLEKLNKNIITFMIKICFFILFIGNYNLKYIYQEYTLRGAYIPFNTILKENSSKIKQQETAEYKHIYGLYTKDTKLKEIKERIYKIYFSNH